MTPYPGGRREIHEVFARPAAANNVIACTAQTGELGQLYVSDDAGETWAALPIPGSEPRFLSPVTPFWLYRACGRHNPNYLCRSWDGGCNWEPLIEVPAGIHLLSGGTDGQRLILHIGSPGGFVSSLPGAQAAAALGTIPGRGRLSGAGIYRLTILLPTDRLYLPVVSR